VLDHFDRRQKEEMMLGAFWKPVVATVAVMFVLVIWWILRRGRGLAEPAAGTGTGR